MTTRITVRVSRDGPYWVGFPDHYPGSCMGSTASEPMAEAQLILPWMACGPDGRPAAGVEVDYVFAEAPARH